MASVVRKAPLGACCLTFTDIKQLYARLTERVLEALELETQLVHKSQTQENIDQVRDKLRSSFVVSVVINGADGQTVVDRTHSVFESNNVPDDISTVYFTSISTFEVNFKRKPAHHFVVNFDFTKPPLIDFVNHSALPTPNNSYIEVFGESENWVSGVFDTVWGKVKARKNEREFLHKAFVYDVSLWFLGLPLSLYVLSWVSAWIESIIHSSYVRVALIIYCVLLMLIVFRMLFSYTKWAFPRIELVTDNSKTRLHRKWWFAILTGVLGSLLASLKIW